MAVIEERVHPPLIGWYDGSTEAKALYPGDGCRIGPDCNVCPRYRCDRCRRLRPWCFGAADGHGNWCDACWSSHLRKAPCPRCGEAKDPKRSRPPGRRGRRAFTSLRTGDAPMSAASPGTSPCRPGREVTETGEVPPRSEP